MPYVILLPLPLPQPRPRTHRQNLRCTGGHSSSTRIRQNVQREIRARVMLDCLTQRLPARFPATQLLSIPRPHNSAQGLIHQIMLFVIDCSS
jgi:hypothetical protein